MMKFKKLFVFSLLPSLLLASACQTKENAATPTCSHTHTTEIEAREATCTQTGVLQTVCSDCQTVLNTQEQPMKSHFYSTVREESKKATHTEDGITVKVCLDCGDRIEQILEAEGHSFTTLNTTYPYFISTDGTKATYYKSCACGAIGEETFTITPSATVNYEATSPTLTLYDTSESLSYGITWNYQGEPYTPVVALRKRGDTEWSYHTANATQYSTQTQTGSAQFYVCKAVLPLQPDVDYEYQLTELATGAKSALYSFKSVQPDKEAFTFLSFSDTQDNDATDGNWNTVLRNASKADFYLHTGDICEDTAHEYYWTNMLDYNKNYLATTPLMVTAGNHDTVYKSGSNELFKHFHNQLPTQTSTLRGYYYSFTYANAKFIVLNSNDLSNDELPSAQYSWLVNELENNDKRWTIVSIHCPLYSVGSYGTTNGATSRSLRSQLSDLFAQYHVDLVLQGHDHTFSKTFPIAENGEIIKAQTKKINGVSYSDNPQGPIYIMNATTSKSKARQMTDSYEAEFYEYAESGKNNVWAEYAVTAESITVKVKYLTSTGVSTYKAWGITKN